MNEVPQVTNITKIRSITRRNALHKVPDGELQLNVSAFSSHLLPRPITGKIKLPFEVRKEERERERERERDFYTD